MKLIKILLPLVIIFAGLSFLYKSYILPFFFKPTPKSQITEGNIKIKENADSDNDIVTLVEGLNIPWELVFLPDGSMLVTERPGNLVRIGKDRNIIKIEGVNHVGEGGLLGLALDPDYSNNNFIYIYFTYKEGKDVLNRIERYKYTEVDKLTDRTIVLQGIKGSSNHDGGRIRFGPDKYLYVTTGDAQSPKLAQDKSSLNGKILRIDRNGKAAPGNPFGNEVYSMGHRNVQGIGWDKEGNLWASEHGPSGSNSGFDEINLIRPGGNYGWPEVYGASVRSEYIAPVIESGESDTWAPAGLTIKDDTVFFTGLRGNALYKFKIVKDEKPELTALFKGEYGRLRTIVEGPDGNLYLLTNNRDGRGRPVKTDDRIIKINPKILLR